jgi:hypothetical protein
MKRTLLAVGVAVLISLMFVPHRIVSAQEILDSSLPAESIWGHHKWLPFYMIGWYNPEFDHVLWTQFALQTVFLALLAAVLVNIPWRRHKHRE